MEHYFTPAILIPIWILPPILARFVQLIVARTAQPRITAPNAIVNGVIHVQTQHHAALDTLTLF